MKTILTALALIVGTCTAVAQEDASCAVADHLVAADFQLPNVKAAVADKRLNIAVIGTASSTLPDSGTNKGYPWRLESALAKKLPGVAVKVTIHAKPRETATDMEKQFTQILAADKPALVIWQTGTVEAIRRSDVDDFRSVLDEGIEILRANKSDIILMNMQYSPRTELMMAGPLYADTMRIVALQHEIPLFDRMSIMRQWAELGTFDFNEITKKIDTAARVHDCIGRLLARQVLEGANLPSAVDHAIR
jgi:hypothetical protein